MGERSRSEPTSFSSGRGPLKLESSSSKETEETSFSTSLDILELGVELSEHVRIFIQDKGIKDHLADRRRLWYLRQTIQKGKKIC